MNIKIETDVLIVGSGPAGSSCGLMLASYGVSCMLVTKFNWTCRTPRAHITNQRALEVIRDLGIEDQVEEKATRQSYMGNNVFCESLAGEELGRLHSWGNHPLRKADYDLASPCSICDIPQNYMEPILLSNAAQRGCKIRFNTEFLSFEQNENEVIATVYDHLTKEEYQIKAKYLVGADGGNSKVAEQANIAMEGKMGVAGSINIVFDADLTKYVAHRPSVLYWVLQPGADVGGIGMGLVRMVRPWNRWLIVWGYDIQQPAPTVDNTAAIKIVRDLVGDKDLEVKIDSTSIWTVNHMYGLENTRGRVFCMGDSVHRHPPSNGLGSNTSIQDAYNLAWKLAFVLKKQASPNLLKSYEIERAPIAKQIVNRANQSIEEFGPIFEALGLLATKDPEQMKRNMEKRTENTEAAATQREKLRKAILFKSYEFNCHGVELNHRYQSDAVVSDGTPEPAWKRDKELYYQETTWPGARIPHVWLEKNGKTVSTLDIVGKGRFTLITGIGGEDWVRAAKQYSEKSGVEIATFIIGPKQDARDIYGDWPDRREIEESGCLLVRPDAHIAWRSIKKSNNAGSEIEQVMNKILQS